jgi:transposase InsO family protein
MDPCVSHPISGTQELLNYAVTRDRIDLRVSLTRQGEIGTQFTSADFTQVLKDAGVRISMDGKGRWMDNIFIERLWRSLKYECVYLWDVENGFQAQRGIGAWFEYYNLERPHSLFGDRTPLEVYNARMAA